MPRNFSITRRTVLRGLGASLALPWLEAMRPAVASDAGRAPVRMAFIYVPGGVNMDEWLPDGEGADYRPRFTLEALAPVREDVLVLSGLDGREGGDRRQRASAGVWPVAQQRAA